MRKLYIITIIALLPTITLAQFSMNGSAKKIRDSVYQLTSTQSGSAGTIWDSTRLDINKSFDISFNLRFGCSNQGEDGIAFVLQRDNAGLSAISRNANSMGYQNGILRSVAIEFDTDRNGGNDINADHVAIHQNGAQNLLLEGPEPMYLDSRNVEDCGLHRVRITYNISTNIIVVYVDCQQVLTATIDLENDIFNGANTAFMGFTASNGSSNTPHLVEYIGPSRDLTFGFDLASVCPDTLFLNPDLNRNEFKDIQWEVRYKGNLEHTATTYQSIYKAPETGTYNIQMSVLRVCDSIRITRQTTLDAINETDISLSAEIDTTCDEYKLRVRTGCKTCDDLQWDFDQQKGAWGFPNQILNFTRTSNTTATFWAQARNASCYAEDSIKFDLKILSQTAPPISFSTDTLCAGNTLKIMLDTTMGDSTGLNFSPGFGLNSVGSTSLSEVNINPTGFGQLGVFRSVHYPKYSCVFNDTHYIQIDTFPEANFVVLDSNKNCNRIIYEFENTSRFAQRQRWVSTYDTSSALNYSELVTFPRRYDLKLITYNGACTDTATWTTSPELYFPPESDLSSDSIEGCSPFTVDFEWSSDPMDSFQIIFGNGNDTFGQSRFAVLDETYTSGTYDITYITYSGNDQCKDTTVLEDYIIVRDSVVAKLGIADLGGCPPFRLDISDSSFFGNAEIQNKYVSVTESDQPNFRQVYFLNDEDTVLGNEGTYNLLYYVSNGYCTDTVGAEIVVKGLTKKRDTVDLYGVTIDQNGNAEFTWKPEPVAEYYDVTRVDDAGSERVFREITDTALIDFSINSNRTQYNYTVTAIDDCGARSADSYISSTILLQGEVSAEQIAELNWNAYERFPQGVRNYAVQDVNGTPVNTNGTQLFDDEFFDENRPDSGRCYIVFAYENRGDSFVSASNVLCLDPQTQVFFPTAFSPNGDPDNEIFMWKGVGVKEAQIRVFNRWGQRVFEGRNEWDGTFEGVTCADGLYYYLATFTGTSGETYFYSGEVYLIK